MPAVPESDPAPPTVGANCSICDIEIVYKQGEDTYWGGVMPDGEELEIMMTLYDAVGFLERWAWEHARTAKCQTSPGIFASKSVAKEAAEYIRNGDGA